MGERLLEDISLLLKEARGILDKFKEVAAPDNVPFRRENLGALEGGIFQEPSYVGHPQPPSRHRYYTED